MKKSVSIFWIISFFLLAILSNAQQVVISDDGSTSAAGGAMLEVKSSTKGFLAPQVALTATNAASPVTSPATGLMVFNTATEGTSPYNVTPGYYYNAGTPAAPNWAKVMKEDLANGMTFQSDGSPILNGTATSFTDLVVNPATARNSGGTTPNWSQFVSTNIYTWHFADGAIQEVNFSVQLPHGYKEGSTIYPHIHWAPSSVAAALTRVRWVLEYQWVDLHGAFTATTATSAVGTEVVDGATESLVQYEHAITPIGTGIVGTGKKISSILMCRLYRDGGGVGDNFTGTAALLSIDFHYEIDTFGSRTEFTK